MLRHILLARTLLVGLICLSSIPASGSGRERLLPATATDRACYVAWEGSGDGAKTSFESVANIRDRLVKEIRSKGLPAFAQTTPTGEVPIVLLNGATIREYRWLRAASLSYFIELHPTSDFDHGGFRIGDHWVDLWMPGGRGHDAGELHDTGLAWKDVETYMSQRTESSRRIIELVFPLSPYEMTIAEYYHRVRRAGIFRVRWEFHAEEDASWGRHPQILWSGRENCFAYPVAGHGHEHIAEMTSVLKRMGAVDVDTYLTKPKVKAFLERSRQAILSARLDEPGTLHHGMLASSGALEIMRPDLPASVTTSEAQTAFMSFIVGVDATRRYLELMSDLGLTTRDSLDVANRRASNVFVWDNHPGSVPAFFSGSYEYKGHATGIYGGAHNHPL